MAAILKLFDGTNSIDFVTAGSRYRLKDKGLNIPLPDVKRLSGGEPILTEGERISARQYGNREITIQFRMIGSTDDDIVDAVRDLTRMIDQAKKTATRLVGDRIELRYKFENSTDEVAFDVLDGEFSAPSDWNSTIRRRSAKLMDCSLKLICRPFARSPYPIEICNYLINPSFDYNPKKGGNDAAYYLELDSTAKTLTTGTAVANFAAVGAGAPWMMVAGWAPGGGSAGTVRQLMVCGHTTKSWRIFVDTDDLLYFEFFESGGTQRLLASTTVVDTVNDFFFAAVIYTSNGTDVNALWFINDQLEAVFRSATAITMRSPGGNFEVGGSTNAWGGRVYGFAIITQNMMPFQAQYLFQYGLTSLYTNAAATMPKSYWGLSQADCGGIFPFDLLDFGSITTVTDYSGNGRHLTVNGSPTHTQRTRKPQYWTIGSDFETSKLSGLYASKKKFGLFSCRFKEPPAAGTSALQFASGTYTGTGSSPSDQSITGLGFAPKMVAVKGNTASHGHGIIRTTAMSLPRNLTNNSSDDVLGLDSDGFTVHTIGSPPANGRLNEVGVLYYWWAVGGAAVAVGTYTGNGTSKVVTGVGFQPVMLFVVTANNVDSMWYVGSMGSGGGRGFGNTTYTTTVTSLDADGFTMGSNTNFNANGIVYPYIAFKADSALDSGTYSGNGADNRDLPSSPMAFDPIFAQVGGAPVQPCQWKIPALTGDTSLGYTSALGPSNGVKSLTGAAGKFRVGTGSTVNLSGQTYYFFAIGSVAGGGAANFSISQVITVPTIPATIHPSWTIYFWLNSIADATDSIEVTLSDGNGTNTHTITPGFLDQWRQFIITRGMNGNLTLTFKWTQSNVDIDILVDAPVVCTGLPFGTFDAFTDITAVAKPYVGSRWLGAIPSTDVISGIGLSDVNHELYVTNFLDVRGFPGDAPATCRLYLKNSDTGPVTIGPLRVGARMDCEPFKQWSFWRAAWFSLIGTAGAAFDTVLPNHQVTSGSGTLQDKLRAPMQLLFPFPSDQVGTHKLYIIHNSLQAFAPIARITTKYVSFPLTGDPVTDVSAAAANPHAVDAGLLSWPPATALGQLRDNILGGKYRTASKDNVTPSLALAAISESVISSPNVKWNGMMAIPCDDGFFTLFPGANDALTGLQNGEIVVVDTIERDNQSISYIMNEFIEAGGSVQRRMTHAGLDTTGYGTGFYITPDSDGAFWVMPSRLVTSPSHYPLGVFNELHNMEAWIEYQPRYLYV